MLTKFRHFIHCCISLLALCVPLESDAQAWLVTPAEAQMSRQAEPSGDPGAPRRPVSKAPPPPEAPRIELRAPALGQALDSPVRIDLRFMATAPARIQPESFRVRYGSLRLDITTRLRASANVTPEGLEVAQAHLPKGSHRLFLEIRDSEDRLGQQVVEFEVR